LRLADFRAVDCREADLRVADLRVADLRVADFRVADFRVADLRVVALRLADLRLADFRVVDLRLAALRLADLRLADLRAVPRCVPFRFRVAAAFFADRLRAAAGREAEAAPPRRPPFLAGPLLVRLPRPEPLFFPPPVDLFTVAQARRSASPRETPLSS
jgi:hypothetical protein